MWQSSKRSFWNKFKQYLLGRKSSLSAEGESNGRGWLWVMAAVCADCSKFLSRYLKSQPSYQLSLKPKERHFLIQEPPKNIGPTSLPQDAACALCQNKGIDSGRRCRGGDMGSGNLRESAEEGRGRNSRAWCQEISKQQLDIKIRRNPLQMEEAKTH